MHSRPQGPTLLPMWPWWTLAPGLVPIPSQVGVEPCRCCGDGDGDGGGGGIFGQSAGAIVGGKGE